MSTNTPNQLQSRLTQIAMAVKPEGLIADAVCPRVPVEAEEFRYTVYAEETFFNIPNTRIGRKSEPTEVEFGGSLMDASTFDYGLDDFVPQKDIDKAASQLGNYDPMAVATEGTSIMVDLSREQRVATLYQTAANFATGLKSTLSGTSQWSDGTNSDPIAAIKDAQDLMLVDPNIMVVGRAVASQLSRHPKIVAAILGKMGVGAANSATGLITMQALAEYLGLKAIYVGNSWYNSAKPGQTASMARLWGKHATLMRIDTAIRSVSSPAMPTFAATAEYRGRRVKVLPDAKRGIDGGNTVRVIEQLNEIVLWQKAGYLFTNAVA